MNTWKIYVTKKAKNLKEHVSTIHSECTLNVSQIL